MHRKRTLWPITWRVWKNENAWTCSFPPITIKFVGTQSISGLSTLTTRVNWQIVAQIILHVKHFYPTLAFIKKTILQLAHDRWAQFAKLLTFAVIFVTKSFVHLQALGFHGRYHGLKITELKNSFSVIFSALGINFNQVQKFTIFFT